LAVRDPRVFSEDKERFLDLMEKYFEISDGKKDARPGVTPGGTKMRATDIKLKLHQYPICLRQENELFWGELQTGCAVIVIPSAESLTSTSAFGQILSSEEIANVKRSMGLLRDAFHITKEEKEKLTKYHMEKGLNYGYRVDDVKEFLETRIRYTDRTNKSSSNITNICNNISNNSSKSRGLQRIPEPEIPIEDYSTSVDRLFQTLSKISIDLLKGLANRIGLHEDAFVSLTDLYDHLEGCESITQAPVLHSAPPIDGTISASLLRVCRYPNDLFERQSSSSTSSTKAEEAVNSDISDDNCGSGNSSKFSSGSGSAEDGDENNYSGVKIFSEGAKEIQFGAHTDTSFLTLGIVSKTPGLEILRKSEEWYPIEYFANKSPDAEPDDIKIVIFLGELLHMVTKGVYEACVHRVVSYRPSVLDHSSLQSNIERDLIISPDPLDRISCPFIVRGKLSATVRWRDPEVFVHPGGQAALTSLPDFDELNMKLLHKFLDIKRAKCVGKNKSRGASRNIDNNNDYSATSLSPSSKSDEWILQSSLKKK
jgi:isopenicillin N synthase-like dioxygenase